MSTGSRHNALRLARVSLVLTSLVFGGFGVMFLFWPGMIASAGVELTSPSARTEIRGFYGGLEIGLALFFALAAMREAWFRSGLVAQAASLGGVALARGFGLIVDGEPQTVMYVLLVAETAGSLLGLAGLWRLWGVLLGPGNMTRC